MPTCRRSLTTRCRKRSAEIKNFTANRAGSKPRRSPQTTSTDDKVACCESLEETRRQTVYRRARRTKTTLISVCFAFVRLRRRARNFSRAARQISLTKKGKRINAAPRNESRDAGLHQQLFELSRRLSRNNRSLFANGRASRRSQPHQNFAGLRAKLRHERGLYAQNECVSRRLLRHLRANLRQMRGGVRKFVRASRRFYGSLRRNVPQVRRIVPEDVFDVIEKLL